MRSRVQVRIQGGVFLVLLLATVGLLGYLGTQYRASFDWTAAGRHTLSNTTLEVLAAIKEPIEVRVFARADESLRREIAAALKPFIDANPNFRVSYINPELEPQLARDSDVRADGTLVLRIGQRKENLSRVYEQELTNALMRLSRSDPRTVSFLTGHGERPPDGDANHGFSTWTRALRDQGFKIETWQYDGHAQVPTETSTLVLSQPQTRLLPGEAEAILAYVAKGGSLLWLADPEPLHGLEPLAQALGVKFAPGTLIDPVSQLSVGSAAFAFATADAYQPHPLLDGFDMNTLFTLTTGITVDAGAGWQAAPLIRVGAQGWIEQGSLKDKKVAFDAATDTRGPVDIAVALERDIDGKAQRGVVVGDGDFLSNSYVGNGGNLDLGMSLVNWLAGDDALVGIAPKVALDNRLELSTTAQAVIGFGFLPILPLLLAGIGGAAWLRRRNL